jgi:hypothetical protein
MVTPRPRNIVRREMCFFVRNSIAISSSGHQAIGPSGHQAIGPSGHRAIN